MIQIRALGESIDLTGAVTPVEHENDSSPRRRPWWRTDSSGRGSAERLIVVSALRITIMVFALGIFVLVAWRLRLLLLLLAVSVFIALLLNPLVTFFMRRGLGRTPATMSVYAIVLAVVAAVGYEFVHPLYEAATHFAANLPMYVKQAQNGKGQVGHILKQLHLANYVSRNAPHLDNLIKRLDKPALSAGKTVVSGFAGLITIGFVSFFVLLEVPKLFSAALDWLEPERASSTRRIVDAMAKQVTGFMLGNFATSLIAGLVIYVTLLIVGVPYASVLALWVGLIDFLPLVGGLLAGIPIVLLSFIHSIAAGIVTVVVFLVYQQLENHILNPLIISRTVRLNPLWVLLSVLIGTEVGDIIGSTFGAIAGAILAVPAAGMIQVGLREMIAEHYPNRRREAASVSRRARARRSSNV